MKKYIYILLAIFLMLVGCKKEERVGNNQIKVGLVKLEVEVKSGVVFYRGDKLENHLSSFVLVGTYSNGARKNLELKREYVKEFDLSSFDQGTIRIEVDGIGVEVGVEVIDRDANLIFREYFDTQADWHSGLLINDRGSYINDKLYDGINPATRIDEYQSHRLGHFIPEKWYSVRQAEQYYSPRNGYPNHHENIEILAKNSDKAFGGNGKSAVFWRESHQNNSWEWNSDGILFKHLEGGYNELYVEFWITFDPNSTVNSHELSNTNNTDASKIFRIESWNEEGSEYKGFEGGNVGPIMIWGWGQSDYGIRNGLTWRGGPHGENYRFDPGDIENGPTIGNFINHIEAQGPNGETEYPIDREHGGLVKDNLDYKGLAHHKQVFGDKGQWSKMAFYVKMNSDIGKKDGVFIQWLNGRRLVTCNTIPWIEASSENKMVKWNSISLGGNDYFHSYPIEVAREEWYSIDNIRVYDGIPSHAEEDINFE